MKNCGQHLVFSAPFDRRKMPDTVANPCQLCGRIVKRGTTKHHLIPRRCHRNKWFQARFSREQMQVTISVCRDCHSAIHKFVPREKDLGRHHNSIDLLLAHPEIGKFVNWVSKQK